MAGASDPLALRSGRLSLGLVPAIGGSVSHLRHDGTDLMRPLSPAAEEAGDVLGVAMFPMMPYANRIAGNAFTFRGRRHEVEANNPPERFNVHGTAWRRPWTVTEATGSEATLALSVPLGDGPFAYEARQRLTLDAAGLTVALDLRNAGPEAMPFGLGLHPWFPRDPDATLGFEATRFYLEEPEHLAGDAITLPPELDFARERLLPGSWRNNGYGGWAGEAIVRFPSRGLGLRMVADPLFGHLMLYADPTRPYFCVEPQSNASGAFSRPRGFDDPAEGVVVLAPGERVGGTVRFEVLTSG